MVRGNVPDFRALVQQENVWRCFCHQHKLLASEYRGSEQMRELATGYGLVEGPVWHGELGLLYSDVLNGGVFRAAKDGTISQQVPKRPSPVCTSSATQTPPAARTAS